MEIVIVPTPADGGRIVADVVARALAGPGPVNLGLATGSSPLLAYAELIRRHREDGLSFAGASAYLLDEYVGLPAGHPQSYRQVIRRRAHRPRRHRPGPRARPGRHPPRPGQGRRGVRAAAHRRRADPGAAARDRHQRPHRVQRAQLVAGVDDPDQDPREPHPGRQRPLLRPAREDVPRHVLTQGLGTIRRAEHLVLTASGTQKAAAVAAAVEGPLTASCPASVLQLHPHATVVVDEAAAALLRDAEFYREVYTHKPAHQQH